MTKRNSKWSKEQLAEISKIQQKTRVSRKTAIRKMLAACTDEAKAPKKTAKKAARKHAASKMAKIATRTNPKKAVKAAGADTRKVSAARAEGIRLFKLAGRPSKEQFISVYGAMGAKWTWEQRAKAVGLSTAEEAARNFQGALAKVAKA